MGDEGFASSSPAAAFSSNYRHASRDGFAAPRSVVASALSFAPPWLALADILRG
jgi:hypothetical protein